MSEKWVKVLVDFSLSSLRLIQGLRTLFLLIVVMRSSQATAVRKLTVCSMSSLWKYMEMFLVKSSLTSRNIIDYQKIRNQYLVVLLYGDFKNSWCQVRVVQEWNGNLCSVNKYKYASPVSSKQLLWCLQRWMQLWKISNENFNPVLRCRQCKGLHKTGKGCSAPCDDCCGQWLWRWHKQLLLCIRKTPHKGITDWFRSSLLSWTILYVAYMF